MSLMELNGLRRIAKTMGVEGTHRMGVAALKEAIAAADAKLEQQPTRGPGDVEYSVPAHVTDTDARLAAETPASTWSGMTDDPSKLPWSYDCSGCGILVGPADSFTMIGDKVWCGKCRTTMDRCAIAVADEIGADAIGTCRGCGETVALADPGVGTDEIGVVCRRCRGVDPVKSCTSDQEARLRDVIAEDREVPRAVIDGKQNGKPFRHLAIPGLRVSLCMKTLPLGKPTTGALTTVDCVACMDAFVETMRGQALA